MTPNSKPFWDSLLRRSHSGTAKSPQRRRSSQRLRGLVTLYALAAVLSVGGCCPERLNPAPVLQPLPAGDPKVLTAELLRRQSKWVDHPDDTTTLPSEDLEWLLERRAARVAYVEALKAAGRWAK